MIIPEPKIETVRHDLTGLCLRDRIRHIWLYPPQFRLLDNYIIELDNGIKIITPKRFITDFASIPRLLWSVPGFSPLGPLRYGAIPHDFGYQYGYLLALKNENIKVDKNFKELVHAVELRCKSSVDMKNVQPVYIGFKQAFFDHKLSVITTAANGAKIVPEVAKFALQLRGHVAWDKYRKFGPTAYGDNSLKLPGLVNWGFLF